MCDNLHTFTLISNTQLISSFEVVESFFDLKTVFQSKPFVDVYLKPNGGIFLLITPSDVQSAVASKIRSDY